MFRRSRTAGARAPTPPPPPAPQDSLCFATLGVRGLNREGTRNPGSTVSYTFNTNTSYQFAGALYTTETQYTLSGSNSTVMTGVNTTGSVATTTDFAQKGDECGEAGKTCVELLATADYTETVFNYDQFVHDAQLNAYHLPVLPDDHHGRHGRAPVRGHRQV